MVLKAVASGTMFGLCDPSSTPGLAGCEGCQALNLAEKNKLCFLRGFDIEKLSEYIGEPEAEKAGFGGIERMGKPFWIMRTA